MVPIDNPNDRKIPLCINVFSLQENRTLHRSRPLFANPVAAKVERVGKVTAVLPPNMLAPFGNSLATGPPSVRFTFVKRAKIESLRATVGTREFILRVPE